MQDYRELQTLLAEIAQSTNTQFTPEELAQLTATPDAEKTAANIRDTVSSKIKHRQVALENSEFEELEGEIAQKALANPKVNIEEIGVTEVKVVGKAVLKINQEIE